jgi:hypothetical protein
MQKTNARCCVAQGRGVAPVNPPADEYFPVVKAGTA